MLHCRPPVRRLLSNQLHQGSGKAGDLERLFIDWLESDASVQAFAKIHEYRHEFLHRPYLKADGMPASYSPDFIVRTADKIFIVETKAQSALMRRERAAQTASSYFLGRSDQYPRFRGSIRTRVAYVLLGEQTVRDWKERNARASDLLEFAKLRPKDAPAQSAFDLGASPPTIAEQVGELPLGDKL